MFKNSKFKTQSFEFQPKFNILKLESKRDEDSSRMTIGVCSANISIGLITIVSDEVLSIVNNRITGIIGESFDRYLVHKGKRWVYY